MQTGVSPQESLSAEAGLRGRIYFILLFYPASALIIYLLGKWSPNGPCNPGMGMMSLIFLFIPISAGMILYNLKSVYRKGKSYFITTGLHIIGLVTVFKLF
jgi:hypothetical protein